MDFRAEAEKYVTEQIEQAAREKTVSALLAPSRFSVPEVSFSASEAEERLRRCVARAESLEASADPLSGSSAQIVLADASLSKLGIMIVWREGNKRKNSDEARRIARMIMADEKLSTRIVQSACKPIGEAMAAAISLRVGAVFRELDKSKLEGKKLENVVSRKQKRIAKFKKELALSVRMLSLDGVQVDDIREAVDEVLVKMVYEE